MAVYQWKTKPYRHQVRGVKFALSQFKRGLGVAFLMEPRTGKTKTTIDTLSILHHKYGLKKILIVAPNRVLHTWIQEIITHCPLTVQTVVWDAEARKRPIVPAPPAYDMQVVLVNYEAFSTPGRRLASGRRSTANGRAKTKSHLLRWLNGDEAACVIDEGHKIKNPQGKSAKMIVSLRRVFRFRFLLTGTPITKARRIHDVYMQWKWVNPDRFDSWGSTVEQFKEYTGRWISSNGFPQWVSQRKKGVDEVRKGIHTDGIVVLRNDCFDLPPVDTVKHVIDLGSSGKHYDEMAQRMVTRLKNGRVAEASIPLVVTLRLMQLTSGFVGIKEPGMNARGEEIMTVSHHRVGMEKLNRLEEILIEDFVEKEQKVVIAARFNTDLDDIISLCESLKIPVWSIRGGMSLDDSTEAIRNFTQCEGVGAIVVQPQAASLGIDLSSAAHMIWYSLTYSWTDFSQCCDRIALSRTSTTFIFILARGTVDEVLYETLIEDGNMNRLLMRKPEVLLRR